MLDALSDSEQLLVCSIQFRGDVGLRQTGKLTFEGPLKPFKEPLSDRILAISPPT
jgi:hypothetical protein